MHITQFRICVFESILYSVKNILKRLSSKSFCTCIYLKCNFISHIIRYYVRKYSAIVLFVTKKMSFSPILPPVPLGNKLLLLSFVLNLETSIKGTINNIVKMLFHFFRTAPSMFYSIAVFAEVHTFPASKRCSA